MSSKGNRVAVKSRIQASSIGYLLTRWDCPDSAGSSLFQVPARDCDRRDCCVGCRFSSAESAFEVPPLSFSRQPSWLLDQVSSKGDRNVVVWTMQFIILSRRTEQCGDIFRKHV